MRYSPSAEEAIRVLYLKELKQKIKQKKSPKTMDLIRLREEVEYQVNMKKPQITPRLQETKQR